MTTEPDKKLRLDNWLVQNNLALSRNKAQAMIMAGEVLLNGQTEFAADKTVKAQDKISLKEKSCPYVSRGGVKLKGALDAFKINAKGKICLDIGVATGGFSHCFLLEGAKEVWGVDVGRGQLAGELLRFDNFRFKPQTNARYLKAEDFPVKFEAAAVDVSFISLTKILIPLFRCLAPKADVVLLVKPQFELAPKDVPRGIVKTEENRQKALKTVMDFFEENIAAKFNAKKIAVINSPLEGVHGNLEFLVHLKNG